VDCANDRRCFGNLLLYDNCRPQVISNGWWPLHQSKELFGGALGIRGGHDSADQRDTI
jgi:hypothetical protein